MSDTILGGDFTVYYLDENRQKRIEWTGSASGTRTVNQLYSALQDHFDEVDRMDDGTPMSAQTPVEYTIGKIDSGDAEPWYISYKTMEHLTGGAVRTNGWARVQDSNAGIIVVAVTSNAIVAGDVGLDISGATTGAGTLMEVIEAGATDYLVIRPDTSAAAQNFTTNSQTITCNAHTATQSGATSNTGEQIWANLYSIGTIESDTHVYIYQGVASLNASRIRKYSITDSTQDWWGDGHIDMCLYIKDFKTTSYTTIDAGYATVYARRGNTLYDSFEVATSLTSGGRNPIPLSTAPDLDNTTGYKSITFTAGSGSWNVGDEISGGTSLARAIITKIDNPGSTQTLHYFLIADPLTDFQTAAETITNADTAASGTKNGSAPADQGPALQSWFTNNAFPTIAFGNTTADINDDSTLEYYGITVDCNQNPLSQVYEWLKYVTRFGATITTNTNGVPGESYIGAEVYLAYSGSITGTISEGNDVTQETSGATGVIISIDTTNKVILLRNTRGTFATHATTHTLTDNDAAGTVEINSAAITFGPKKSAPFGTFAGGTFFGARGVLLADWASSDENSFQLTPVPGGTYERPQAITISVTNLVGGAETSTVSDRVAVFRLTGSGGVIDKTEFSAAGGEAIGAATLTVDGAIPQDVPGKTSGGVLRIRDFSDNNKGYRIRFSSWSGSVFTLANIVVASADGGTDTDTIVEAGAFTNAKRGDIVVNHTRAEAVSYVTAVTDANTIQISPAIASQTSGDSIELNCIPITMNTADDVYVSLIDQFATASSASVSIVYVDPLYFRVIVRNSAATTKILPFTTDDSTSGTDRSIATIRTTDTIIT
jgi:hypothetical protein